MEPVVITPDDVPEVTFCPRLVSTPEVTYKDWHVFARKPVYVGEPIAVVAAETEEQAQTAMELLKVEYEPLPASYDALDAMNLGTMLHDEITLKENQLRIESNIACTLDNQEGDVETGFKEADIVIERTYRTNRRYHLQLETKRVLVKPEPDGGVTIWSTTQTLHNTRLLLHEIFGLQWARYAS